MYRKNHSIPVILLIALFQITDGRAQPKAEKSGFAAHMGVGSLFAGMGIMMEYQFLLSERIKFNPFFSIGSQGPFTEIPGTWEGYTSGFNIELGSNCFHRGTALNCLIGFNYGSQGVGFDEIYISPVHASGLYINKHLLTGFALIAGYRLINRRGLIFQTYIGMTYVQPPIGRSNHYLFRPTGGFGIGYKF